MEAALTGPQGRMVLGQMDITIGRAPHNTIVVSNDPKSSSNHALIRQLGSGYSVVDVGSTNGTFVNEQRLAPNVPRQLMPNDAIRIGETVFRYEAAAMQMPQTVFDNGIPATVAAPPPFPATVAAPAPYAGYNRAEPALPDLPALPDDRNNNNRRARSAPKPVKQQPVQKQRRRNPVGAIIGIIVLLLVLVVGFFVAKSVLGPHSTPDQTMTTFCTALQNNDYPTAYKQLSSNAQQRETEQQFASGLRSGFNRVGGLSACTAQPATINGNSASSMMQWTFNTFAGQAVPVPTQLISENGIWKIDSAKPQVQGAPGI